MRLSYLDSLRGMVMLMVVFCHTCGDFCLDCKESVWVGRIFGIVMLPGFFFVSGWFSHILLLGGVITKRLTKMLLPTVLMFLIYVFLYWGNMEKLGSCALGEYKFGYWFTFALFLMNILHWGVSACFRTVKKGKDLFVMIGLGFLAIVLIVLKNWDWNQNHALLANWLSLRLISMYFPFYLLGMLCRYKIDVFHRLICNEYVIAFVMLAFSVGLIRENGGFYFGMLMGAMGVMLLYRFCFCYQDVFSEKTFVGRQLCMIGRNTLPIYLIHYFFFLGLKLPMVGEWLDTPSLWFAKIIVAFILTLLICYASIGMLKMVAISKPLAKILLGK